MSAALTPGSSAARRVAYAERAAAPNAPTPLSGLARGSKTTAAKAAASAAQEELEGRRIALEAAETDEARVGNGTGHSMW